MKKLSMLDKSISLVNPKYNEFSIWANYETHWANGEYLSETAPIHRMFISEKVLNSTPTRDTHVGSMGETNNETNFVIVQHDGSVVRVEPVTATHRSNYAYEDPWEEDGVTVGEFMHMRGVKIESVKFIVQIVQNYESWGETERERSVIIYGQKFAPNTVLKSFERIYGENPWILHTTAKPKTADGPINMDMRDYERIRLHQKELEREFLDKQEFVEKLMVSVFGEEIARRLVNFINFGDF